MDKRKCVLLIEESLTPAEALNVVGHLAAHLGALFPALARQRAAHAGQVIHAGPLLCHSVVLTTDTKQMHHVLEVANRRAELMADVVILNFSEQDEPLPSECFLRDVVQVETSQIQCLGLILLGPQNVIGRLTKGCRAWRDQTASPLGKTRIIPGTEFP